ncbi:hypothetical protein ElyMa_003200100 [Elysia marginata]|uniref:Uncharacterized protein n=1 Tax=Elysia marginata TaxID=1093978 RepID=A0AAV4J2R4_9GAST|nr:hypothetical protein ElyMa_003200100 [Elysia marginata]
MPVHARAWCMSGVGPSSLGPCPFNPAAFPIYLTVQVFRCQRQNSTERAETAAIAQSPTQVGCVGWLNAHQPSPVIQSVVPTPDWLAGWCRRGYCFGLPPRRPIIWCYF